LDKLLNIEEDVDEDEDLGDLEDELEFLNKQDKHIEQPVVVAKQPNADNQKSGSADTRLKGLHDNLNLFKKKLNDAAHNNDSSKQRRFKRFCDVSHCVLTSSLTSGSSCLPMTV
jgi:hypothetical protein